MRCRLPVLTVSLSVLALAACGDNAPTAPTPVETEIPEDLQTQPSAPPQAQGEEPLGTPMAERVATVGLLNKRNNLSEDIQLKPGESRRVGNAIIRVSACERTAPWEMPKQTGVFVQLLVDDNSDGEDWTTVFSGWLFKESPSVNVVEHPVYDVWVKDCAMSFPGDDRPGASTPPPASPSEPSPTPEAAATNEA